LPLGWRLLGWVLVALCMAVPVWALAAEDLTQAARWAPLMALPLTALGLAWCWLTVIVAGRQRRWSTRSAVLGWLRRWIGWWSAPNWVTVWSQH
jgi:hypothetical protein